MIETIYPNPERKRVQKSKSRVSLVEASESPVNVISEANGMTITVHIFIYFMDNVCDLNPSSIELIVSGSSSLWVARVHALSLR